MIIRSFWRQLPAVLVGLFFLFVSIPFISDATSKDNRIIILNNGITISSPPNVALGNFDRGTDSSGTADWVVATNNPTGYKLELSESNSPPALVNDASPTIYYFDDYNMDSTSAPTTWSVDTSGAEFGFTATGDHGGSEYVSGTKYRGFSGATLIQIATSPMATSGTTTTVRFRAQLGSAKYLRQGGYSATIIATATAL